jgi:hypothetical protein
MLALRRIAFANVRGLKPMPPRAFFDNVVSTFQGRLGLLLPTRYAPFCLKQLELL